MQTRCQSVGARLAVYVLCGIFPFDTTTACSPTLSSMSREMAPSSCLEAASATTAFSVGNPIFSSCWSLRGNMNDYLNESHKLKLLQEIMWGDWNEPKTIYYMNKVITNRREETDDLGTSTFALGSSGASCNDASIPARSICSSNTSASDWAAESFITQSGTGSTHWWWFRTDGSLRRGAAAWSAGLLWGSDL